MNRIHFIVLKTESQAIGTERLAQQGLSGPTEQGDRAQERSCWLHKGRWSQGISVRGILAIPTVSWLDLTRTEASEAQVAGHLVQEVFITKALKAAEMWDAEGPSEQSRECRKCLEGSAGTQASRKGGEHAKGSEKWDPQWKALRRPLFR